MSEATTKPSYAVPVFAALSAIGFAITIWLVFTYTPLAQDLFFNQKIFYYHVAHAFMMFAAVALCGVSSIAFLKFRKPKWDDIALASAEVAVALGAVVLITGSIWGKAAWDVWWTWEKRLTMSLLLWLTLVAYVIVRRFAGSSADRMAAGLAVFGTVALPFIYFMVDRSDRHPQAGVAAALEPKMKLVFWLSVATFLCWFLALVIARIQSARAERELRELRERGLDTGVLT
ncbi:MAG: cytochrome c biogenesis protein CcsA [Deltaproteobacteria bacterium]|nr:cytochrome c biogenesis protein CcsA [Deltaproteobacteria bacterium]MDQ3295257.1 cytochrome c biogenesis protein [Myxococcota bacterium]